MATIPIDIALPAPWTTQLTPPTCADITIPPPPPKFSLCLPFGGAMAAIVDTTKMIPDDCAITFSILLQLPPLMASLGCFIKVLKLAEPLKDFFTGVPNPVSMVKAAGEIIPVVIDIAECFTGLITNIPKFIRDLLYLIAKLLRCIGQQLLSIAKLMSGIQLSLQTAEAAGNQALLAQLQCAQGNLSAQAQNALGQTDVIQLLLTLAQPMMALIPGGAPTISIPTFGSATDAQSLEDTANVMLSVAASLQEIGDALDKIFPGTC